MGARAGIIVLVSKRWCALAALVVLAGCATDSKGVERDAGGEDAAADVVVDAALGEPALFDAAAGEVPVDAASDPGHELPGDEPSDELPGDEPGDDAPPEPDEPPPPPEPADPPDPPRGPIERTFRVIHWNVAGVKLHRGRTDTGLVRELMRVVESHGAQLIGLNEVCRSQFDAIVAALRARGWPRDASRFAYFQASRGAGTTPSGCGAFGNAIFSRPALGAASRLELPSDGTVESRWLLCARLADLPHMRFCTTHLTPRLAGGENRAQLREVFRALDARRAAGDTVILTGDLNIEPDRATLDAVYAPGVDTPNNRGNHGEYRELDDADRDHCIGYGEATGRSAGGGACGRGRKIDYIFVPRDRIVWSAGYSADARSLVRTCATDDGGLCSDHRMLTGRVRLRIER